jgi:hypothetical protein
MATLVQRALWAQLAQLAQLAQMALLAQLVPQVLQDSPCRITIIGRMCHHH